MTDRLTDAIAEAYASAPAGVVVIDTLELSHPSLASPIRVATGDWWPTWGVVGG
jgi:hypothetical protein